MNRYAPLYIGTAGQSDELTPELAGSKAALIWQMTRLGLNVPPAFVFAEQRRMSRECVTPHPAADISLTTGAWDRNWLGDHEPGRAKPEWGAAPR